MVNGLRQKTFIECRYLRLDAWRYRQHGRLFAADRLDDLCNAAFLFPVRSVLAFRLSDVAPAVVARLAPVCARLRWYIVLRVNGGGRLIPIGPNDAR